MLPENYYSIHSPEMDFNCMLWEPLTLYDKVFAWLGECGEGASNVRGGEGAGACSRGVGANGLLGVDGRELLGVAKHVVDCDNLCCTIFWQAETRILQIIILLLYLTDITFVLVYISDKLLITTPVAGNLDCWMLHWKELAIPLSTVIIPKSPTRSQEELMKMLQRNYHLKISHIRV